MIIMTTLRNDFCNNKPPLQTYLTWHFQFIMQTKFYSNSLTNDNPRLNDLTFPTHPARLMLCQVFQTFLNKMRNFCQINSTTLARERQCHPLYVHWKLLVLVLLCLRPLHCPLYLLVSFFLTSVLFFSTVSVLQISASLVHHRFRLDFNPLISLSSPSKLLQSISPS